MLTVAGGVVLIFTEILRVYFIMPFPGSQHANTLSLAYFIHQNAVYLRLIGVLLLAYPLYAGLKYKLFRQITLTSVTLVIWLMVYFVMAGRLQADKMFYQPKAVIMATQTENVLPLSTVIIGINHNGCQRAYPIELIGYHHQVRDTVCGLQVMVTYCTVCRTGRIFLPVVNNRTENFRLVGMDHFNAMFEDQTTKTWWRQVNGKAVIGPLKGMQLMELPYEQMTLAAWLEQYPQTLIMQPDSGFINEYNKLAGYATGKKKGKLTGTDTLSWKDKSWVVGITIEGKSRAYDWRYLLKKKIVHDTLNNVSLLIAVEPDSLSFHVWQRADTLKFIATESHVLKDLNTHSVWNYHGICTEGRLKGLKLKPLQAHQEYWHSWRTFQPATTVFKDNE